ncbi:MAG: hypothetical protein QGG25_00295, partial [Phycisphaerae bacterium]|nr:hypothetical protein [Phycisphaerae bacterium]
LHFEIQPRMFHVPHKQYVVDEYPRAPLLRSPTTTTDEKGYSVDEPFLAKPARANDDQYIKA